MALIPRASATPTRLSPGVYRTTSGLATPRGGMMNQIPRANTTPPAPTFNATTDPRRSNYLRQWQTTTDAGRKAAIDAKWGFSRDPSLTTGSTGSTITTTTNPIAESGGPANDPSGISSNINALFPYQAGGDQSAYLNSKLYQQRLNLGQRALDRQLAARGLSNSGAALEASSNLTDKIGAEEEAAARQLLQEEANRMERMVGNESNRLTNLQNSQQDNLFKALDLMMRSWDPAEGFKAGQQLTDLQSTFGSTISKLIQAMAPRATARTTGGPGPFIPPFASGPNTYASDILGNRADAASSARNQNVLNNIVGSFF